jgi:chromosome segregation ATPase
MARAVSESKLARAQRSTRQLRKRIADTERQIEKLVGRADNLRQDLRRQTTDLEQSMARERLAAAERDAADGDPAAALAAAALEDEVNA